MRNTWLQRYYFLGCCFQDLCKQYTVFFSSFFFLCAFLPSKICKHTIVLTVSQFVRNPVLFCRRD